MVANSSNLAKTLSLLVIFGLSMGVLIVLAKQVVGAGISGLTIAVVQNMAAGGLLIMLSLCRGHRLNGRWPPIWYILLSANFGIALPHWLVFTATPRIGAGMASVLYLFAPVMTYAIALIVRHDRWDGRRGLGMLLGFAGATSIVYGSFHTYLSPTSTVSWQWLLVGLLAPLSLAVGNVFRSEFWPASVPIMLLSGFTLLMAGALLLPISTFTWPEPAVLIDQWQLLMAMVLIAAFGYLAFFALQFSTGAVYVSQSGYLITATGVAGGMWLFSEVIGWRTWLGIFLVCIGVGFTTSQLLERRN